jgi:phosphocarrier protein HPr
MKNTRRVGENDGVPNLARIPRGAIVRVLRISNQKGLHARASAKFVQTVEKFDVDVQVSRGHETVGGTSIMGLMMLAAGPGTEITVVASGPERAEVVAALELLVNERFGEDD